MADQVPARRIDAAKKHTTSLPLQEVPSSTLFESVVHAWFSKISGLFRGGFFGGAAAFLLVAVQPLAAATREETLQAINWVENPSNSSRPGVYGELGAYQFRASTWRMHSKLPFVYATDRRYSDEVAILHYEWIKTALGRAGIEPTVYRIAVAWNAGVGAVTRSRIRPSTHNYATRVNNLVVDLNSRVAVVAMK